jgi:hypothetical protein
MSLPSPERLVGTACEPSQKAICCSHVIIIIIIIIII